MPVVHDSQRVAYGNFEMGSTKFVPSEGSDPVILFLPKFKTLRDVKYPKDIGISPVRWLPARSSTCSFFNPTKAGKRTQQERRNKYQQEDISIMISAVHIILLEYLLS